MIPRDLGSLSNTPDKEAIIYDIQRYSIHDGPGIRTIVFFKGCHLRCRWCSNPESQSSRPEIMWRERVCIHCGKCEQLCPVSAISEMPGGKKEINRDLCERCGICDENCYAHAIQLVGRYITVSEVLHEVEKDSPFYSESGGGITLGGGEPLAQPDFAKRLLRESKHCGFHTVVETAGHVPWENIACVAGYTDLFLYDIKTMDAEIHKRYTWVGNEMILENARKLSGMNARVIIRVPVIPDVNDTEESVRSIAEFVGGLGVEGIELLAYHRLGTSKYSGLGREYLMKDMEAPSEGVMDRLKIIAKEAMRRKTITV